MLIIFDIVRLGNLFNFKSFLIVLTLKLCFCKWHHRIKGHETCVAMFIHKLHLIRQDPTTASYRHIQRLGRAFEHHFGFAPGGGGGRQVLKFRVDHHITTSDVTFLVIYHFALQQPDCNQYLTDGCIPSCLIARSMIY